MLFGAVTVVIGGEVVGSNSDAVHWKENTFTKNLCGLDTIEIVARHIYANIAKDVLIFFNFLIW